MGPIWFPFAPAMLAARFQSRERPKEELRKGPGGSQQLVAPHFVRRLFFSAGWGLSSWGLLVVAILLSASAATHSSAAIYLATGEGAVRAEKATSASPTCSIKIELTQRDFQKMSPVSLSSAIRSASKEGPSNQRPDSEELPDLVVNSVGLGFPWVDAKIVAECSEETKGPLQCRIRYAGDFSYLIASTDSKRPMEVELVGEKLINDWVRIRLYSMQLDSSKLRELVVSRLFHNMGLPVSAAVPVEIQLIQSDSGTEQFLGLYAAVESVDSQSLERMAALENPLVLKPYSYNDLRHLGDSWEAYEVFLHPQREPKATEKARIISFAKLVSLADQETFERDIESFIDTDQFLRFVAANVLSANLRGFIGSGHNYFLCLDSESNRFTFVPGDLEGSLGNIRSMGSFEDLTRLDVFAPFPAECRLVSRVLSIPRFRNRYEEILVESLENEWSAEETGRIISELSQSISEARVRDTQALNQRRGHVAENDREGSREIDSIRSIERFLEMRRESIQRQLAGESQGFRPSRFVSSETPSVSSETQAKSSTSSTGENGNHESGGPRPPVEIRQVDPKDRSVVGNMSPFEALEKTFAIRGDADRGAVLFKENSCTVCHTTKDSDDSKGFNLSKIGSRRDAKSLLESIIRPGGTIVEGHETFALATTDGRVISGFIVEETSENTVLRQSNGLTHTIANQDIETRSQLPESSMPQGLVGGLTPDQLADLIAFLKSQ